MFIERISKKPKELFGRDLFDLVVKAMDRKKYTYTPHRDDLYLSTNFSGDDLDITVRIRTYPNRTILAFDCPLDFEVDQHSEAEVSIALREINEINSGINYGCFTLRGGRIWFRYHYLLTGPISVDDIIGMLEMSVSTVDEYDGKLAQTIKRRSVPTYADWDGINNRIQIR